MDSKRNVLATMFAISVAIHLLLGIVWSARRMYTVQNVAGANTKAFTVYKTISASLTHAPLPTRVRGNTALAKGEPEFHQMPPSELLGKSLMLEEFSSYADKAGEKQEDLANLRLGPFQSEIDPRKAWINVAESTNYSLLNGISMDLSKDEFRLPDEVDVRIRAKGALSIEYPLIAAAMGKEAAVYALLLIDEQGQKTRVQVVHGDADFDNAVLSALEKIEFRPAMLKSIPVRSLLILEFDFRRNPPEPGSL